MTSESVPEALNSATSQAAAHSSSLWDRTSTWVADHRYTVAGVTFVITSAGVYYLLSSSSSKGDGKPKKSKKERRKEKLDVESGKQTPPVEEICQ